MANYSAEDTDRQATQVVERRQIELLAPARDGATARAALQCGADAVYIGAPQVNTSGRAGGLKREPLKAVYL